MKLMISASLIIKEEHEEAFKEDLPSTEALNKELKYQLTQVLTGNPVFESWNITGYLHE